MVRSQKFKLYGQCVPVKGAKRSIICDLQRDNYEFIPNELYTILTKHSDKTGHEVVDIYGSANEKTVLDYFHFLVKNEFGFWTNSPDLFPANSTKWEHPSAITNAILDWNKQTDYDFATVFSQLEELDCEHIQIRFFEKISLKKFESVLALLDESSIVSVEIIQKYDPTFTEKYYHFLLRRFLRVTNIFIHSSPFEKAFNNANIDGPLIKIIYLKNKIDSETHCGQISEGYFAINSDAFNESLQFNSCLNRKIAIDKTGLIKNCPSMEEDFGHVKKTPLKEALLNKKFRQNWTIKKDDITVCKACEFRYICTDCRAYTANNEKLGKPSKCNYNPYTATWE